MELLSRSALLLATLLALVGRAVAVADDVEATAVRAAFKGCEVEKRLVLPRPEQRSALASSIGADHVPRVFTCWIARRDGAVEGFAVIDDVIGKSEPITYLVATDASVHVRAVEILTYRESHGGEVRQAAWREQFVGKDARSRLRVGDDVRNIAGATISCRSVTDGVRRELILLETLASDAAGGARAPAAPACAGVAEGDRHARTRLEMGTTLRITTSGIDASAADRAIDAAFDEVARLERELSTWIDDSPASRLCAAAGADPIAIPSDLAACLDTALGVARASDGAFDPVCGAAVELWRAAAARNARPDDDSIELARSRSGARLLELDVEASRARLAVAGARIDLGAIGKGYALDRAAAVLEQHGAHVALLDFGGQMLALDPPRGERGWRVELRDPARPDATCGSLLLARASVSTSADYERGLVVAGRAVSHHVDPRTARPVEGTLGAVVVHSSATLADAWSTALFVLGPERGIAAARARGLDARITSSTGAIAQTDGFAARLDGARNR